MNYLTSDRFKEGMKITCEFWRHEVFDAKLHFENGEWFICQNVEQGSPCKNKLGYKYSWKISATPEYYKISRVFTLKDKINILRKELAK
jgi:hypothetical protein